MKAPEDERVHDVGKDEASLPGERIAELFR